MKILRHLLFLILAFLHNAPAQTAIDLSRQSKNADFSQFSSTRPVRTGAALPATCTVGELFIQLNAPVGLYACIDVNLWTQAGQSGSGALAVLSNGTPAGTRPAIDMISGTGIVNAISDNGVSILVQQNVDTAMLQTRPLAQSGATVRCVSASASATTYTCGMNPVLGTYTPGMVLYWQPDLDGAGGPITLNIDTLGDIPVKLSDGVTNPAGPEIAAGRLTPLWYDGTVFRLLLPVVNASGGTATRPACSASYRGRIWQVLGGEGVKDELSVCAKDDTDTYDWRVVY